MNGRLRLSKHPIEDISIKSTESIIVRAASPYAKGQSNPSKLTKHTNQLPHKNPSESTMGNPKVESKISIHT